MQNYKEPISTNMRSQGIRPYGGLSYEHMFSWNAPPPLKRRARNALCLARSFLLLEDDRDGEVDWEVDQDEPGRGPIEDRRGPRSAGAGGADWAYTSLLELLLPPFPERVVPGSQGAPPVPPARRVLLSGSHRPLHRVSHHPHRIPLRERWSVRNRRAGQPAPAPQVCLCSCNRSTTVEHAPPTRTGRPRATRV
jgi:hypothetical protein